MYLKRGFSLIELSIVVFISSILILSIYNLIRQTKKSLSNILQIVDADSNYITFYNQIFKDISCITELNSTNKFYKDKFKNIKNKKVEDKQSFKDENNDNIINNIFYIKEDKNSIFLSFLTTSGVNFLDQNGNIPFKNSLIKRVAYIFENNNNYITIYYKESYSNLKLEYIKSNDIVGYKLAEGLSNLNFSFSLFEYTSLKEDKSNLKKTFINEWNEEEIYNKYKSLIPAYITINGSLVNFNNVEKYSFTLDFKIYSYRKNFDLNQEDKNIKIGKNISSSNTVDAVK